MCVAAVQSGYQMPAACACLSMRLGCDGKCTQRSIANPAQEAGEPKAICRARTEVSICVVDVINRGMFICIRPSAVSTLSLRLLAEVQLVWRS